MKRLIACFLLMTLVTAFAPVAWAPPMPPHAVLTVSPNPGCVGEPITLDGCGSYHDEPTVSIVLYELDLDDDGEFDDWSSATECVTSHTYMSEVAVQVWLRVTDEYGMQDVASVALVISGASATEASTWGRIKSLYK